MIGSHVIDALEGRTRTWVLPAAAVAGAVAVLGEVIWNADPVRALVWGGAAGLELAVILGVVRFVGRGAGRPVISWVVLLLATLMLSFAVRLNLSLLGVFWLPAAVLIGRLARRLAAPCLVLAGRRHRDHRLAVSPLHR